MDQHTITPEGGDDQATSFKHPSPVHIPCFGRDLDIRICQTLLYYSPLVTITGPGGVGKSTVLRSVMQSLVKKTDRRDTTICWSFDLTALSSPLLSPFSLSHVLKSLRRCGAAMPTWQDLAAPHTVLALDNCDHQMDAIVWFIDQCLRAFPHLHILVSSREICHLSREVVWRISPLPVPSLHVHEPWEDALANPAIQILLKRLQTAQPQYCPDTREVAALVSLCRSLEGLPLALELAAEQHVLRSVQQLADELRHHPESMLAWQSYQRDIPHHHRTIGNSQAYSLARLGKEDRELINALTVFADGWDLEAMYHVCADLPGDVATLDQRLHRLIDCSLVCARTETNASDPSWEADGPVSTVTRYYLLESTRYYLWHQLSASLQASLQRKMVAYYVALAETFEGRLRSPKQQFWLARLNLEQGNLKNALNAAGQIHEPLSALQLASSLWLYWILNMQLREGRSQLEQLIEAREELPLSLRATALYRLGMIAFFQGDNISVEACALESLALFRKIHDQQGVVLALSLLLHVALCQNNLLLAQKLGIVCQAWAHAMPDLWHATIMRISLIIVFGRQRCFDDAWQLGTQVVQTWRLLGDRWGEAYALDALGQIASFQGDYSESIAYFRQSLHAFQDLNYEEGVARTLLHLGLDLIEQEDFLEARAILEASMTMCQRFGRQIGVARAALGLARIHIHLAAYNIAAPYLTDCLECFQQHGDIRSFHIALTILEGLTTLHPTLYLRATLQRFRQDWIRVQSHGIVAGSGGSSSPPVYSLFEVATLLNGLTASTTQDVLAEHVVHRKDGWQTVIDISRRVIDTDTSDQSGLSLSLIQRPSILGADLAQSDRLTAREMEILQLLDEGKSNEHIAANLVISRGTVRTHLSAIYRKLQVNSRTAALHAARIHHLLP